MDGSGEPLAKKKPVDFHLCLKCQDIRSRNGVFEPLVNKPHPESLEQFLDAISKRAKLNNPEYVALWQR